MHSPHFSFSCTLHITMLASAQGTGREWFKEGFGKTVNSGAQERGTIIPRSPETYLRWYTFLKCIGNIGYLREKCHGNRNLVTTFSSEVLMIIRKYFIAWKLQTKGKKALWMSTGVGEWRYLIPSYLSFDLCTFIQHINWAPVVYSAVYQALEI